jgi:hypothetical protein
LFLSSLSLSCHCPVVVLSCLVFLFLLSFSCLFCFLVLSWPYLCPCIVSPRPFQFRRTLGEPSSLWSCICPALPCLVWSWSWSCPCLVLPCLVFSFVVLSYPVLSCPILSCLVLSCLVLSCVVLSYLILPFPALAWLALPCFVLFCFVLFCLVLSCLVLACLVCVMLLTRGLVLLLYPNPNSKIYPEPNPKPILNPKSSLTLIRTLTVTLSPIRPENVAKYGLTKYTPSRSFISDYGWVFYF